MSNGDRKAYSAGNHPSEANKVNQEVRAKSHQLIKKDGRQFSPILSVKWTCRWDVFRRLQALGIECECSTNKPLLVYLDSPTTAVQIRSVIRQFSASRQELIDWLDNCWQVKYDHQSR